MTRIPHMRFTIRCATMTYKQVAHKDAVVRKPDELGKDESVGVCAGQLCCL